MNNPNKNFIGIEQVETVLAIALKKVIDKELTNVKLIRVNANEMLNIFDTKWMDDDNIWGDYPQNDTKQY